MEQEKRENKREKTRTSNYCNMTASQKKEGAAEE